MIGSASISGRNRARLAAALLPLLALPACGSSDQAMSEKLAAAEAAANKAVEAQRAAERAAAIAANARPAPAAEPMPARSDDDNNGDNDDPGGNDGPDFTPSMPGGPGQTVAEDGTVIPG